MAITITDPGPLTAYVGYPFRFELEVITDADDWTVYASGALPPGITRTWGSGVIRGTPEETGSWVVTMEAAEQDEGGNDSTEADPVDLTFTVITAPAFGIVDPSPLRATLDEPFTYTFRTIPMDADGWNIETANLPPGLDAPGWGTNTISGTPTSVGTYTDIEIYANTEDELGNAEDEDTIMVSIVVTAPAVAPVITDPGPLSLTVGTEYSLQLEALPTQDTTWTADGLPPGITLTEGGRFTGTPTSAGDYPVDVTALVFPDLVDTLTLALLVEAGAGPGPGTDPSPDEWFGSWDALADGLAGKVAGYVGRPGDPYTVAVARAQLPVIAEYVRGYTRGQGWTGDRPAGPLMAVIVSAAGRLVTNPEQVTSYTANDYSERPAVLAGWTLTELGVLRRYRKVSA